MASVRVASVNDLKDGQSKVVEAQGQEIALFRAGGKFFATSNACPHAGGPLGEGELDKNCITCPFHGWQYDITNGSCLTNPSIKVQTFPVQVKGNDVLVDV